MHRFSIRISPAIAGAEGGSDDYLMVKKSRAYAPTSDAAKSGSRLAERRTEDIGGSRKKLDAASPS
jgi:hypothetical protein